MRELERRRLRPLVFDVRPGERRVVALAFATLFSFMVGHGILETARDALFLTSHPPERLPFVYLAIAVGGLFAVRISALMRAAHGRRLPIALGSIALVTATLSLLVGRGGPAISYVVYVWSALAATGATVEMWQFMGDRFTVDQAKRVFGLVGAGAVLGVATGSLVASILAPKIPPAGLVLTSALAMVVGAVVPNFIQMRPGPEQARSSPGSGAGKRRPSVFEVIRDEPYTRRLLAIAVLTTSSLTIADFLFKTNVVRLVAPEDLAVFLGRLYAGINVLGLLVQMIATSWILRTFGASRGLLFLPLVLFVGAAAFTVMPIFGLILAMKIVDGSLRHSVQRIGLEVLFLPLSDRARRAAKGLIEVAGHRGAQALASGGILIATQLTAGHTVLSVALLTLAGLWILVLLRASEEYVGLFREYVRAGAAEVRTPLPELDVRALEVLLMSLHSGDEREVLAALRLLDRHHKAHLVPALLVYHPSRAVALEALEVMACSRRRDVLPLLGSLLAGDDPERRAAALRAHHAILPDPRVLEAHAGDATPRVKATILVALMARDDAAPDIRARIDAIVDGEDRELKRAVARAIAEDAHERWIPTLVVLAKDHDVDVKRHVAEAARILASQILVPGLIGMLAIRRLRDAARDALESIGDAALPMLMASLASPETPRDVRRHIPRTLSRFHEPEVAACLLQRLPAETDGMARFKILFALWRMKNASPDLPLDEAVLTDRAMATLDRIITLVGYKVALGQRPSVPTPRRRLLEGLLAEKQQRALDRLFMMLSLLHPTEQYDVVFEALRREDPRARAASREILSSTLRDTFRGPVLALTDDVDDATKLRWLGHGQPPPSLRAVVDIMARDRSQAVRMLAESYREELGLAAHTGGQHAEVRA